MQARLHRWRFNLKTGATTEEPLSENISEFGMINATHGGEPYRYVYAATGKPGWFLFDGLIRHDVMTGTEQRISFGDGVYGAVRLRWHRELAAAARTTGTWSL